MWKRTTKLPKPQQLGSFPFLICDRKLFKVSPAFSIWIRQFPLRHLVTAGEKLKAVESFPQHVTAIAKKCSGIPHRELTVVCVGGGSVTDFGGFVASVLKRGVRLVHIPSTWLAAIDAAHGGKNGLNVDGVKNQLGTFFLPEKVLLVKELLMTQPQLRARDAMSELVKIALLSGGALYSQLEKSCHDAPTLLWSLLDDAITAKMQIVAQDPREEEGTRRLLNLGHTIGHVLEAAHGWSHGRAVASGLRFSVAWSGHRRLLPSSEGERIQRVFERHLLLQREERVSLSKWRELLLHDKKQTHSNKISFSFLRGIGKPLQQEVTIDEIVAQARVLKWL